MIDFYLISPGNVEKYTTEKKQNIKKFRSYYIFYFILISFAFVSTYLIFLNCIGEEKLLPDTIALGSIFATFGSSLVGVFSLIMGSEYDRFISNYNVLFKQLKPEKYWKRWAFIKRESHQGLFNNEHAYQKLTNAKVKFNVGSHPILLDIPTIKEDFFDLPNWRNLLKMKLEAKDFESHVLNKCKQPADPLMVWDCIFDNFKIISKYKIAKAMVVLGESYILASIIMAFSYRFL